MILKKPYAFLIKNFKIIHIILALVLSFVFYKTTKLYGFLNDYLNEKYYDVSTHFATKYIGITLLVCVIIIIAFSVGLYLLMKFKNKNKKYYFLLGIVYLCLFGIFIYYFFYLTDMEVTDVVDKKVLRIVRDSVFIIEVPQLIFTLFAYFRGLGFDLKSFNFKKDLAELEIKVEDSEEFELTVKDESYKVKRNLRKSIKEFYYYYVENKFMINSLLVIILVVTSSSLFIYYKINNNMKAQNANYTTNGFVYNIKSSYVTTVNYRGDIIKKNYKYVVVNADITNINYQAKEINVNNIKLINGSNTYYPKYNMYDNFIDLGKGYKRGKTLSTNDKTNYIFVFELKEKETIQDLKFRIDKADDSDTKKVHMSKVDFKLEPLTSSDKVKVKSYNVNEQVNMEKSNLLNTTMTIKSFDLADSFESKYKYCANTKCFTGVKLLTGNEVMTYPKCVLKIKMDYSPSKQSFAYLNINSKKDLLNSYLQATYIIDGESKNTDLKEITPSNSIDEFRYFEANEELLKSKNIKLFITARDIKYEIKVK